MKLVTLNLRDDQFIEDFFARSVLYMNGREFQQTMLSVSLQVMKREGASRILHVVSRVGGIIPEVGRFRSFDIFLRHFQG